MRCTIRPRPAFTLVELLVVIAIIGILVGGGQFGLGDGSVRFVSENIDTATYRAFATISSGEVVSSAD